MLHTLPNIPEISKPRVTNPPNFQYVSSKISSAVVQNPQNFKTKVNKSLKIIPIKAIFPICDITEGLSALLTQILLSSDVSATIVFAFPI